MAKLDDQITALATMSPAQLQEAWQQRFGEPAPCASPSLLRLALAYRMQEQVHGGLAAATQRIIAGLKSGSAPVERSIMLKPGTRLLREWNGTVHCVLVVEDGLMFEERRFASLSQVAKEITGSHWSGPRFFGLKRPVNPPARGITSVG